MAFADWARVNSMLHLQKLMAIAQEWEFLESEKLARPSSMSELQVNNCFWRYGENSCLNQTKRGDESLSPSILCLSPKASTGADKEMISHCSGFCDPIPIGDISSRLMR